MLSHCTNVSMQLQVQCHDHIIGKAPTAALWASSANNVKKPLLSKILKFWFTKMPKLLLKNIIGITIIIHICYNYIGFKVSLHFCQSWPTVRRCKDPGTTTWKWKQVLRLLLPVCYHSTLNQILWCCSQMGFFLLILSYNYQGYTEQHILSQILPLSYRIGCSILG